MEDKPRAIVLTKLAIEETAAGRKMLNCIFTNRYSEQQYHYKWMPPWQTKENNIGIEQLFFKSLDVEKWNDPDGAWSKELDAASKEYRALEDVKPIMRISLGEVWEEHKDSDFLYCGPGWIINFIIDSDIESTCVEEDNKQLFLKIGDCAIAWIGLKKEIDGIQGISAVSETINEQKNYDERGNYIGSDIRFSVWAEECEDKIRYKVLTKEIKYRIMNYLNHRLSKYRMLKRGLED